MLNITEQFFKQIDKCERPLIVFSADWNGDAVASSMALSLFLKKLGKTPEIVAAPSVKSSVWSFLSSETEIKEALTDLQRFIISLDLSNNKIKQVKYEVNNDKLNFIITPESGWFGMKDISTPESGFKYDLIIAINTNDLDSLGKIYDNNVEFFYKTPIINIDCHTSNEEFGQLNLININSATSAEILFNLFQEKSSDLLDEDTATCLLAGIIAGTKNFRAPNLTPQTLLATSKLISLGARREEIVDKLYRSRDFKTLKLWGKVLNNLNSALDGSLIWSTIKRDDFKNAEALEDSLLDIIDELIINIPEAKIITIIFEKPNNNDNKIILHTTKNLNALEILKDYKPIGTPKTAEASTPGELEMVSKKYINDLEFKLKNIN